MKRWAWVLALALSGCASVNPGDPWEAFNRMSFKFNQGLDQAALAPAARAYEAHAPGPVRAGVGNFFGNLADAWSSLNLFAQLHPRQGFEDLGRFALNSTLGVAGLFDVATPSGLGRHRADLGQTLGRWGVPSGPYVVLPLLGPSTARDAAALAGGWRADLWGRADQPWRLGGQALRAVDERSNLLGASDLLEQAALDPYEFTRDFYLQRRQSIVASAQK